MDTTDPNSWDMFDDQRTYTEKEISSREAYLLFYKRKQKSTPITEDQPSSSRRSDRSIKPSRKVIESIETEDAFKSALRERQEESSKPSLQSSTQKPPSKTETHMKAPAETKTGKKSEQEKRKGAEDKDKEAETKKQHKKKWRNSIKE